MDELLGLGFAGLQLAEPVMLHRLAGPLGRIFRAEATRHQRVHEPAGEFLGALAERARQHFDQDIGGAEGPFQALGGDPDPLGPAEGQGLGAAGVVPVQIGRGIGGQQVQLQELGHASAPVSIGDADGSSAGMSRRW